MDTDSSVASGQTSNHLKWSNLDLFFARPPRGGPEKFLFYTEPYESNGTDQR